MTSLVYIYELNYDVNGKNTLAQLAQMQQVAADKPQNFNIVMTWS